MIEQESKCVLLADRHHGLTEGLRGLLATTFNSVVMVADEASLLASVTRLQPQAVIVELSLSSEPGLQWLRKLRESGPELPIVVLSVHDEDSVRRAALEAGADRFLPKHALATDLLPIIDDLVSRNTDKKTNGS